MISVGLHVDVVINMSCLCLNEHNREFLDNDSLLEWMNSDYQLNYEHAMYYCTGATRLICAWIGTHRDPKGNKRVMSSAIWLLVGNHMHLSAIKNKGLYIFVTAILTLLQLFDCYSYNYFLIAFKFMWLPILIGKQKQRAKCQYDTANVLSYIIAICLKYNVIISGRQPFPNIYCMRPLRFKQLIFSNRTVSKMCQYNIMTVTNSI